MGCLQAHHRYVTICPNTMWIMLNSADKAINAVALPKVHWRGTQVMPCATEINGLTADSISMCLTNKGRTNKCFLVNARMTN